MYFVRLTCVAWSLNTTVWGSANQRPLSNSAGRHSDINVSRHIYDLIAVVLRLGYWRSSYTTVVRTWCEIEMLGILSVAESQQQCLSLTRT